MIIIVLISVIVLVWYCCRRDRLRGLQQTDLKSLKSMDSGKLETVSKTVDTKRTVDHVRYDDVVVKSSVQKPEFREPYESSVGYMNDDSVLNSDRGMDDVDRRFISPGYYSMEISDKYGRCMNVSDFTVLDIETTGLDKMFDDIISVSLVRYRNRKPVATYSKLFRAKKPLDKFIKRLTGLTDADLADQPYVTDCIDEIMSFIGDDIIMGYNIIRFDLPFMYAIGFPFDDCHVIDVYLAVKYQFDKTWLGDFKLSTLKNHFNIKNRSHVALNDCYTCAEVYFRVVDNRMDCLQNDYLKKYHVYISGSFVEMRTDRLIKDLRSCGAVISVKPRKVTNLIISDGRVSESVLSLVSSKCLVFTSLSSFCVAFNQNKILKLVSTSSTDFYKEEKARTDSVKLMLKSMDFVKLEKGVDMQIHRLSDQDKQSFNDFSNFYGLGDFAHDWVLFHKSLKDLILYFRRHMNDLTKRQQQIAYLCLYRRCVKFMGRLTDYKELYDSLECRSNKRVRDFVKDAFSEWASASAFFERNEIKVEDLESLVKCTDQYQRYAWKLMNNATTQF